MKNINTINYRTKNKKPIFSQLIDKKKNILIDQSHSY